MGTSGHMSWGPFNKLRFSFEPGLCEGHVGIYESTHAGNGKLLAIPATDIVRLVKEAYVLPVRQRYLAAASEQLRFDGEGFRAYHTGNFSGDVQFEQETESGLVTMSIPAEALLHLVAHHQVAHSLIERTAKASDEDLLIRPYQLIQGL